ncbi:MAG: DUF4416 family protein [Pirellulaceae bacterium]
MATPNLPPPTLMLVAVFSRHDAAIEWALEKVRQEWGPIGLLSQRFDHSETQYYESTMGAGLKKQFAIVDWKPQLAESDRGFYDPSLLAQSKLQSNEWEQELAAETNYEELRPVNVDPGYLTLTKLVLASAKDRAHRIYLSDGIYAEQCLYYLDHCWQSRPWTYPDYQREDFQAFFLEARELLKSRMMQARTS